MSLASFITSDIIFESKASAVPYNYRISYKMALVCCIIGKCCGKKGCSAIKLQMINAATCSTKARDELFALINAPLVVETTLIRFDPGISRTINFALAEHLIYRQSNGLYRLTDKGKALMAAIYADTTTLKKEKDLFEKLSNKLTEDIINRVADNWRLG